MEEMTSGTQRFVTVIIPVLNEEKYIADCINSLLNDRYPADRFEIIVADGGSTDRTVAIVNEAFSSLNVRVLDNPKRFQAAGFNLAMENADYADYLLRCDAHAVYPPGFISAAAGTLNDHPEAGAIVWLAKTITSSRLSGWQKWVQSAIAFTQRSPLGVGGSTYRRGGTGSGYIEHGWQGLFRREAVAAVGGYDETFRANEDSELSHRLIQANWKIWLEASLNVVYYPRSTILGLARQYFIYGDGRAGTVLKHKMRMKLRQLAPVAITAGTPVLVLSSLFSSYFLLPLAAYAGLVVSLAGYEAFKTRDARLLLSALAFPVMHYSWGAGFIRHLIKGCYQRALAEGG